MNKKTDSTEVPFSTGMSIDVETFYKEYLIENPGTTFITIIDTGQLSYKKLVKKYNGRVCPVLLDVSTLTRDEVVPFYRNLIQSNPSDDEVVSINQLILTKWKPSGLIYIKEKAWKGINSNFESN
jgi:hypothetical protein